MVEILIIALIAGLALLTANRYKAIGNIALALLVAIGCIGIGAFILVAVAAAVGGVDYFISK